MTTEKIIDRIQKLLRLSQSSNVNEAANALAQAQNLMEKHRISMSMLDEVDPDDSVDCIDSSVLIESKSGRIAQWKVSLSMGIARVNDCKILRSGNKILVIGSNTDREIHAMMYNWIVTQIESLADKFFASQGRGLGKTGMNNFRLGAVSTVSERLQQEKENAHKEALESGEVNETALVRLEQGMERTNRWMQENFNTVNRRRVGGRYNAGAFNAGKQAGKSVSLQPRKALNS